MKILVRLTEDESAVLDALAAVDRTNRTRIARETLVRALRLARQDPLVREQMEIHERRKAEGTADVLRIDRSALMRRCRDSGEA